MVGNPAIGANMTYLFSKPGTTGHFIHQAGDIRVKKHKSSKPCASKTQSMLAAKTEVPTIDNSFNSKRKPSQQVMPAQSDYMQFMQSQPKVNMNQTQMIINNFFFQPSSPTEERNIKTAGAQRRVSSQGVNPPGGGQQYDFNKIKKDLESVRLRHEEAQQLAKDKEAKEEQKKDTVQV